MKKTVLMSAAKKARIALAVMAVCGMSFVGAQEAFAENVTIDADKNIICGEGVKVENNTLDHRLPENAIVMGNGAVSSCDQSIAIGFKAKVSEGGYRGIGAVAIGAEAEAIEDYSTAIGYQAKAKRYFSTAIGKGAVAENPGDISLGHGAKAFGGNSIAISGSASGEDSIAIGTAAKAEKEKSVAIGRDSLADEENTVSVGNKEYVGSYGITVSENYRRIVNMADGINDHDAATVGQVKSMIAAGGGVSFDGTKLNTDIQNVDVAGGYKDTATNPNVDTKGTVAGAINSAYQAGKEYTDTQLTDKVGIIAGGTYVEAGKNIAENLGKLDTQVKANADAINTKADKDLSNITDAGKNVIKDLAGNKAGEVVDAKLGNITSENYVKKDDTVNANISALDKQMKANADDIITANNKITNVDNKIGDLAKLDTAEKGNLVGAVNEVNKKADKNADDIKTVNGRVDELGGRVDTLGGAVSKLDTKVNKVGAGAAALAALHPMDFDPDNKLSFAAGVGNYAGQNAAAIGAFYRPNEQVMFSIAGNMGNGENMVNAGVSFALDRPSQTPTTKAALVKTVVAQNEQIAALNETVAEQNEKIARLEAMVEKLAAKQNA